MEKLLIVDGNSIINRAYYGIRPLTTRTGLYTNAVYGAVNILSRHLENLKPEYMAVAFDLREPTFRHKMSDAYKANRKPMPDELAMQMPYAKEVFRAMGFTTIEKAGYEADDILGTLSRLAAEKDIAAYVLTGDKDSLQLITDKIFVLLAATGETIVYDGAEFFMKYGVMPEQFVDVKALMGDHSDNIPGVAGIGEKGALKLISQYESLENLYEKLDGATDIPAKMKEKLIGDRANAFLSQTLARIDKFVPLDITLEDTRDKGIDKPNLARLFTELEFGGYIKRFGLSGVSFEKKEADEPHGENDEKPLTAEKEMPVVCELDNAKLSGKKFSLYVADKYYFYDGEKLFTEENIEKIKPLIERGDIICHDEKEMRRHFLSHGITMSEKCFDIMLAAYVLDPGEGSFDLSRLAMKYAGESFENPCEYAGVIFRLHDILKAKIEETNQQSLLYDIEFPLCDVLFKMENAGFKIDSEMLSRYGEKLKQTERETTERIYSLCGCEFNISSPKQLGEVLFEKLGLPPLKKTKTGYSTSADILEKLKSSHPVIEEILEFRKVFKLRSTYVDGLLKVAGDNGRIHTTFKQTGTATGRLSSAEPNLQNIPIRDKLGHELRKCFIPENGYLLIDADYSQIELRLLAHVSGDETMINSFLSGEDIHTTTASQVFRVSPAEVTPEMRKRAKAVNFGIMYGIGAFSLADDLGIPRAYAKQYIDDYLEHFHGVNEYLQSTVKEAYENGYVTTIFGRRRYIPELAGKNKMLKSFGERVAMNSPIQGSAADIIKIAMINVDRRLAEEKLDARLILQVHDELLIEARADCADAAAKLLREEMEGAVKLSVPLSVELSVGENWYENK